MASFTLFTFDGGGNQPPLIGIATELRNRGHAVRVAGYESQRERFHETGLSFVALPRSGGYQAQSGDGMTVLMGMLRSIMCNPDHLSEVVELAENQDAVVIDNLMMFALAAAERHRIPTAVLFHTAAEYFKPSPRRAPMLAALNQIRAEHRLPPVGGPIDLTAFAAAVIVAVQPQLDEYSSEAGPRWHYVGPIFPPSGHFSARLPGDEDDRRPLILVSLTTALAWGPQRDRLQRILDALAPLPVRVIVTTGPTVAPGELQAPANAIAVRYWPHRQLMPHVAVCVTHGGHGTLAEALAGSVPVVVMPNPMSDQSYLAGRVAFHGAGLAIDQDARGAAIAAAVERVLGNPAFRAKAGALGSQIDPAAATRAADIVEKISAHSRQGETRDA